MKKTLVLVLISLMLISLLAGCASTDAATVVASNSESTAAENTSNAPENSSDLIVYTQKTLDAYFHVALQESLEKAVTGNGFQVEVANCNNDTSLQVNQVLNFITKKPKAIIANTVDSDALNDAVNQAKDAGIPVIVVDNPASAAVVDCTVTFDNEKAGYMAAQLIVDKLIEKYGEAKGTVVNVYGAMSSQCWRLRKDGFDACMAQYPAIEYIEVPGEGEQAKSQEALTNILAQYGQVDAVHCPSDSPAMGCAEALKVADMWYPVGHEKHVIFVSCDGEPFAVESITDGYYDGTIVEDAYAYGPMALDMFMNYTFKGQAIPTSGTYTNDKFFWKTAEFSDSENGPVLMVPPYVMDITNIDQEGHWGVMALQAQK